MSASFTPGPWLLLPIEADKSYIRVRGTSLGGRYKIANVLSDSAIGDEAGANARLVVSAPDMLDALELICAMLKAEDGKQDTFGDAYRVAEAALAKARGEA